MEPRFTKFVDALEIELNGQELMFDEHEWITLIKSIKRAWEATSPYEHTVEPDGRIVLEFKDPIEEAWKTREQDND